MSFRQLEGERHPKGVAAGAGRLSGACGASDGSPPPQAPPPNAPLRSTLSQTLSRMLGESVGPVTIHQALDSLGDRSFGGVMLVLALPALVLPPGVSALLGVPLFLVCAQMLLLRPRPWLPDLIGQRGMGRTRAERVFAKAIPILARAESWTRPRFLRVLFPLHEQIIALACMCMSLALILPLPLAHTAAALGISTFGIGLMERDGLAIVGGWLFTAACGGLTLALVASALAGLSLL